MDHLYVLLQVSLLCERFVAEVTLERLGLNVHSIMVFDVASLFENLIAAILLTPEELLELMGPIAKNFNHINHVFRYFSELTGLVLTNDDRAAAVLLLV